MIQYKITTSDDELRQILALQQQNLSKNINTLEKKEQGFVTVEHTFELLKMMHQKQPHIIAKYHNQVIGYALSMVQDFKNEIPVLEPMFTMVDTIFEEAIHKPNYIVMGQICVDKNFRGKGVFRNLYQHMNLFFVGKYDCIITEVDVENIRSMNAHQAVGFEVLKTYHSQGQNWALIQLKVS